jgi:prolyl 4-hydroxylase
LENNIENLDAKTSLCFLDNINTAHISSKPKEVSSLYDSNVIWKIKHFLSDEECDEIILKCDEKGFEDLSYRSSKRLIGFDENTNLIQTIKSRLNENLFNEDFYENKWKCPYGFYTDLINWNKNIKINPCFRINKYESSGFDLHRDAQFTENYFVRSNYTVIVYLNDNYEQGETCFYVSKKEINKTSLHDGKTVQEEIHDKEYECIKIKPKKGMMLMFDQRLLHEGIKSKGTKYILRTDIIATSSQ